MYPDVFLAWGKTCTGSYSHIFWQLKLVTVLLVYHLLENRRNQRENLIPKYTQEMMALVIHTRLCSSGDMGPEAEGYLNPKA